jgi:hypothetical protein
MGTCGLAILTGALSFKALGQELLREASLDSAAARWLNKKVISSRVLDQMQATNHWKSFTTSPPEVVDARIAQKVAEAGQSVAEISLSWEHSREGRQALHLRVLKARPTPQLSSFWRVQSKTPL